MKEKQAHLAFYKSRIAFLSQNRQEGIVCILNSSLSSDAAEMMVNSVCVTVNDVLKQPQQKNKCFSGQCFNPFWFVFKSKTLFTVPCFEQKLEHQWDGQSEGKNIFSSLFLSLFTQYLYNPLHFLDRFIPFGVAGRTVEPIPAVKPLEKSAVQSQKRCFCSMGSTRSVIPHWCNLLFSFLSETQILHLFSSS